MNTDNSIGEMIFTTVKDAAGYGKNRHANTANIAPHHPNSHHQTTYDPKYWSMRGVHMICEVPNGLQFGVRTTNFSNRYSSAHKTIGHLTDLLRTSGYIEINRKNNNSGIIVYYYRPN